MRRIDSIIVHCTATRPDQPYSREQMWHDHVKERGWSSWGYHYYVRRSGKIEGLRPVEQIGAHCRGHNRYSIGVCWEGGIDDQGCPSDNRTPEQILSLRRFLDLLLRTYPAATLHGHNEFARKACPCFDVRREYASLIRRIREQRAARQS